jgi:hypothetical protein
MTVIAFSLGSQGVLLTIGRVLCAVVPPRKELDLPIFAEMQ